MNTLTIIISAILLVTIIFLIIVTIFYYKQKEKLKKTNEEKNECLEEFNVLFRKNLEFIKELSTSENIDRKKLSNIFINNFPWLEVPGIEPTKIVGNLLNAMEQELNSKELNGYINMTAVLYNAINGLTNQLQKILNPDQDTDRLELTIEQKQKALEILTSIGLFTMNAIYRYKSIVKDENCKTEKNIRSIYSEDIEEATFNPKKTDLWARILKAALSDKDLNKINTEFILKGYKF